MKFDRATLKARFHAAQSEKASAEAAIKPLVDQRESILAQMRPLQDQLKAVEDQLRVAKEPIYDLSCEIGGIAKYLRDPDGKTRL